MVSFGDIPTEVAQKCVEFLEFEEATEVKKVSRGLCEGLYREFGGQRDRYNGRLLFSPHSVLRSWGGQLGRCAEQIRLHRVAPHFPPAPQAPESIGIGAALESWTDPNLAARLLDEFRGNTMNHTWLASVAITWSEHWQDRNKAHAFVAEAERIQALYQEEEDELADEAEIHTEERERERHRVTHTITADNIHEFGWD